MATCSLFCAWFEYIFIQVQGWFPSVAHCRGQILHDGPLGRTRTRSLAHSLELWPIVELWRGIRQSALAISWNQVLHCDPWHRTSSSYAVVYSRQWPSKLNTVARRMWSHNGNGFRVYSRSGDKMSSITKENQRSKIQRYCPFNVPLCVFFTMSILYH
jgi:hypothetical protein